MLRIPGITAVLLSATLVLAACESSEERAQKHYESGLALMEQGDVARAEVEFRNVFKLNPRHKDARLAYARTQRDAGKTRGAFKQYLTLVEFYPENLEGRIELARMAMLNRNWEEGERHGRAAFDLAPDNPEVLAIIAALDFVQARRDSNEPEARKQAEYLKGVLQENPQDGVARRIVVEHLVNRQEFDQALIQLNQGIEFEPDSFELLMARLQVQYELEQNDGVEASLKDMVAKFPENADLQRTLIAWYLERQDLEGAEAFLRDLANRPDAEPAAKIVVVQFLTETQGPEAARAELNRLVETEEENLVYRALLASMDFEQGKQDEAIAELEKVLDENEPSDDRRNSQILLARMLLQTNNPVGARSLVEEILTEDSGHVAALKLQAAWLIDEDKPSEAIVALRTALAGAPNDASIMTLMGQAHEREGARELAGERYALAVDVSGAAPAESLRYASFLMADDRIESAQSVIQEALNKAPQNIDLLRNMAMIYIAQQDWNRATRIVWSLRAMETEQATSVANGIEAEVLSRQERTEDTISFLKDMLSEDSGNTGALAALVETQVRDGQLDEATALLEEQLTARPNDPSLRFLRAGLYFLEDDRARAEEEYKKLLEQFPGNDRVLRTYYSLLIAEGRDAEAGALVDKVIAERPDASSALLLKAERLEKAQDFEGAIAIYEDLYAKNSNSVILANNLASLITTHRTDPESLERGFAIASRLRGSTFPPLQDTYGWIEYRRGNYEEALTYLEPAAAGLPEDPLVQYHLGMTYLALERTEDARETLTRALEIAGDMPLPQFDVAREALSKLPAPE